MPTNQQRPIETTATHSRNLGPMNPDRTSTETPRRYPCFCHPPSAERKSTRYESHWHQLPKHLTSIEPPFSVRLTEPLVHRSNASVVHHVVPSSLRPLVGASRVNCYPIPNRLRTEKFRLARGHELHAVAAPTRVDAEPFAKRITKQRQRHRRERSGSVSLQVS